MMPASDRTLEIEIDEVQPSPRGFVLVGVGTDRSPYQMELSVDFPLDKRTRQVLAELLSQSEWKISRLSRLGASRFPDARRNSRVPQAGA